MVLVLGFGLLVATVLLTFADEMFVHARCPLQDAAVNMLLSSDAFRQKVLATAACACLVPVSFC